MTFQTIKSKLEELLSTGESFITAYPAEFSYHDNKPPKSIEFKNKFDTWQHSARMITKQALSIIEDADPNKNTLFIKVDKAQTYSGFYAGGPIKVYVHSPVNQILNVLKSLIEQLDFQIENADSPIKANNKKQIKQQIKKSFPSLSTFFYNSSIEFKGIKIGGGAAGLLFLLISFLLGLILGFYFRG